MLRSKAVVAILVAYCAYAIAFIYRTSFVIGGERFFSLFDDGMISMQYAKNLAHGYGLVWNPGGEHVEGYTNLLWVLYMAILHLLPIAPTKISLLVQLTSAVCLLLNLVVIAKIAETISDGSKPVIVTALVLTAFYLPLNNWALQGMEVGLLALLVSLGVWLALRYLHSGAGLVWPYLVLGAGTLVRPDMVVPFLAVLLCLSIADRARRRRHLIAGIGILALFVAAETAFRWSYYGDPLPNTYYLKMTGYPAALRITRGYLVFLDFLFHANVLLIVLPIGLALARRDVRLMVPAAVVVLQAAYSIYVGGDAWEWWGGCNRYVAIAMPMLFVLLAFGIGTLGRWWESAIDPHSPNARVARLALPAAVLIVLLNLNAIRGPEGWSEWLLLSKPLHAADNKVAAEIALLVKEVSTEQAKVAVVWAGATPYYMDRYAIDLLGKSDKIVAHEPMHLPPPGTAASTFFYPGHLKYDYKYSIGELKPDVITQIWGNPAESAPYLGAYEKVAIGDRALLLRKGSPNIRWDRVAVLSAKPLPQSAGG